MARSQFKPSAEAVPASSSAPPSSSWIYGPAIDLIVGCGAWSAALLLPTYLLSQSDTGRMAMVFYALALVFNYPHFMATIYRAYGTREDFSKYRIFTVHITALLLLTVILTHAAFNLLPWIFTLYINWSPWHYSGQNYGLLMMFARRNGAAPTAAERRALYGAFLVSYAMLLISFHTGPSQGLVLSLGIPQSISYWSRITCGIIFAGLGGFAFYGMIRRAGLRAMLAPLTLFSTQILWFVLPHLLEFGYGWKRPQTLYSSGILAIMHSAQYLWITSYYARREANSVAGGRAWSIVGYFATLVAGGVALFIPGPWLVSYIFHYDITISLLIFTALVNIHHFILDGAIWKLRDGRIAALLLNTRQPLGAENGSSLLGGATHWLRGASTGARALRIATIVLLFVWGGVEVVRYSLSFDGNEISSLTRALRLDPYDSAAETRIARGEVEAGDWPAAVAAWRKAASVNPHQPGPRADLARTLIEHGKYDEAYEQYRQLVALFPGETDALINLGIVSMHEGRAEEAIDCWQRALKQNPRRLELHLFVAQAAHKTQPELAAAQYQEYLQQIVTHPDQRPAPKILVPVLLDFANVNAELHHLGVAVMNYQLAARIASEAKEPAFQSQAYALAADLQAQMGDVAAAAHSYQQAIAVDGAAGSSDVQNLAKDWFNYGQFLRQQHLQSFAYACLAKAEELFRSAPSPELQTAVGLRKKVEAELGPDVASVRRELPKVLAQAAALEQKDFVKPLVNQKPD